MRAKYAAWFLAIGLGQSQPNPALRLGPFHNLQKPGALEVLIETGERRRPEAHDLQLIEDGRRTAYAATLKPFRQSNWKAAFVLALDVSRSISKRDFGEVKKTAADFLSRAKDPVAVVAFGDAVEPVVPFGSTGEAAVAAVMHLDTSGRTTHLYEALDECLRLLEERPAPERRRIVVISDGDEESRTGPDSIDWVLAKAAARRIAIDTMWIPTRAAGARNTLIRASERTDGFHLEARQTGDLVRGLNRAVARVDNSYVAMFDRKVDKAALTKEVGIRDNRAGVSSSAVALQIAASAPEKSWLERFRSLVGFLGEVKTLWGLIGGAALLTGMYFGSFLIIKKYYPQHIHIYPGFLVESGSAPADSQPPPQKKAPGRSGRQTVVERPGEPSSGGLVLEAVAGPVKGTKFRVDPGGFRIGADSDNELPLAADDYVSGHHARIDSTQGQWTVVDLGSRNGTVLDEVRVEQGSARVLRDGQSLRIGTSEFRVLLEGAAAEASAHAGSEPAPR